MPFQFCNVDLDIRSSAPLDDIASHFASFGDRVFPLYCGVYDGGSYFAAFEIHWDEAKFPDDEDGNPTMPEHWGPWERIEAFCELIRALHGTALDRWNSATARVFDLGYESDDHCQPLRVTVPSRILKLAIDVGAEIAFTIYPKSFGDEPADTTST